MKKLIVILVCGKKTADPHPDLRYNGENLLIMNEWSDWIIINLG